MRIPIPDLNVGLRVLVMWIAVVIVLAGAYFLFQWWRAKHPRPKHRDVSYTKALAARRSGRELHQSGGRNKSQARKKSSK